MSKKLLKINFDRLKADIETLAQIGRADDHGIYRPSFSENDMQAREWLKSRIADAELDFYQDGAANLHGRLAWELDQPSVMTGSHIDSVPNGGHLDGALGVLCGLEALRVLKEYKADLVRPLELVAFSDEEGRFGGMFGSQAIAGELTPEAIHSARDLNGVTLTEAMKNVGLDAADILTAARSKESLHAHIELHIEQGPVLDQKQIPIGVVEGICGLQRWNIRLSGISNHAGTTPMTMRADAFQGMVAFASKIQSCLDDVGGERSVATVGRAELIPGAANVVPGQAHFSLEFRDTQADILLALASSFKETLMEVCGRLDLQFEYDVVSNIAPVACDQHVQKVIQNTAQTLGYKTHNMPSGAAHDTQKIANLTRAGMIFVPSKAGRSHSAAEWTAWPDIEAGANVLLNSLYKLASE